MKAKARYEIREVIARGGMGVVYRAQDKMMNRLVALKTINDLSDPRAIRMFQREWQDLASLTHPNIVEVFDVGELEVEGEARPYLVMPLLNGSTLDELIKTASQRLTVERSIDIVSQTARGLQAAHDRGIVHRDLKPSNIFVMPDDAVKIIDFGVAGRLDTTKTMGRKGTLLYMSPEQLENKAISAVSDVFALAVVCYETLTRRRPFERTTEEEVVEAILRVTPPPVSEFNPSVNSMMSQVIQKGMAKAPWHRFASAREFADMLQKAYRNEPIESLNPAKIQGRLQRSQGAFERGDLSLAAEIIGELEAEGHFDPAIAELKQRIDSARLDREIAALLESARVREEHQEYPLALQKIHEILQLNPRHTEALALKSRIDSRRTEADMEEWFRVAHQHLDNFAYSHAREALQRILQLRPREPRALQMLSEVDRREQTYVQLRQQKEELYRAAVEAAQNGEISQALSKAERVLELDKQAPELMDPGRSTSYQSFYNRIRSASESLKDAYDEARALLANRNHAAALAICDEQLRSHPNHALFQALRVDIEEQRRQALSARIAEVDHAVEGESDLNRRVNILEEALHDYPGEPHFERALELTLHRRGLVESIVNKARAHEEKGQFGEAITQWETLQTIHSSYPGLNLELERLRKRRLQQERQDRKGRWVEQIERSLERSEYPAALETLKNALEDFPGDAELAELGKLAERGLERWEESKKLFEAGRVAYEAQRLEEATLHLRRAMELDDRNPAIRSTLIETLVRRAQNAHEHEPQAAETLLREALEIEPNHALAKGLLGLIHDQYRVAQVERCVSHARQLQNENDLRGAMKEVKESLNQYPDDTRLGQLHATLAKALQDERRRDLDEARRIDRDAESVNDPHAAQDYTRRLDTIVTRYQDDEEFVELIDGTRKRLEPITSHPAQAIADASPAARKPPASGGFNWRSSLVMGGAGGLVLAALLVTWMVRSRNRVPAPAAEVATQPAAGQPAPAALAPPPEMQPLTILGSGKFDLDGAPAQDLESVFSKEFPLGGEHVINAYSGKTGQLSFSFTSQAGQPAAVKNVKEKDVLAFFVSTANGQGTIYASHRLQNLRIDGNSLGDVGAEGRALPADLAESNHKLEWQEGQESKSREIRFEKTRGLVVQLDSDSNLGSLVVKLNTPGPVDMILRNKAGGRDISGTAQHGEWRPSALRAGTYTLEGLPRQGFERSTMDVKIQKGLEQRVSMDFKKMVPPAHVLITTAARAHIYLDGNLAGDADSDGKYSFGSIPSGRHKFGAKLAGFRDVESEKDLPEGANETVALTLSRTTGTVVVQKDPAAATVTYSRAGDSRSESFDGSSKELAEGDYTFRAQADGYNDSTTQVSVVAGRYNPVVLRLTAKGRAAEAKAAPSLVGVCQGWTGAQAADVGCKLETTGYHDYGQKIDSGTVEFAVWAVGERIRWQLGYKDERNFWEFELAPKSLRVTEHRNNKKTDRMNQKIDVKQNEWYHLIFNVKPKELRFQVRELHIDQTFGDTEYDFRGSFRIEVKKPPVWMQFAYRQ